MHKKGEDVVNNFSKTLENAKKRLIRKIKESDVTFKFLTLKRSTRLIRAFQSDPRLVKAREALRASASGEMNDLNSQRYGAYANVFQIEMEAMANKISEAIKIKQTDTQKTQQANINRCLNKSTASKNKAIKAWKKIVVNGYDQNAAQALLKESVNEEIYAAHLKTIEAVKKAMKYFPKQGNDICNSIHEELIALYSLSS